MAGAIAPGHLGDTGRPDVALGGGGLVGRHGSWPIPIRPYAPRKIGPPFEPEPQIMSPIAFSVRAWKRVTMGGTFTHTEARPPAGWHRGPKTVTKPFYWQTEATILLMEASCASKCAWICLASSKTAAASLKVA